MNNLPEEFLRLRLDNVNRELKSLPRLKFGTHRNASVIREYFIKDKRLLKREYLTDSERGKRLAAQCRLREELTLKRKILRAAQAVSRVSPRIRVRAVNTIFNRNYFYSLVTRASLEGPSGDYIHNGIAMKSRGEVIVAQILDSLDMTYKYEAQIVMNGKVFYPDFTVYLPEFGRCFFIEFMGMLDRKDYVDDNFTNKVPNYIKGGMRINTDLLLLCGDETSMESVEAMKEEIIALISKYCRIYCDVETVVPVVSI